MEQKTTSTEELGYYVAPRIYDQLQKAKIKVIKGNLDRVYVIDGREGEGGKSTLALQLAYALDKRFNLDNITFKAKEFEDRLREAPEGSAIVFDEAFNGLSSKGALSKENKKLVRVLMEVRQRNLFIFIVLPSLFLLEKYVAIFRSNCLFHCFASSKNVSRRYFKVYNYQNKKMLYIKGKTNMSYYYPKLHKSYRFYKKFPLSIDRDAYDKKKLAAFKDIEAPLSNLEVKHIAQRDFSWWLLVNKYHLSQAKLLRYLESVGLGLDKAQICRIMEDVPKKLRVEDCII